MDDLKQPATNARKPYVKPEVKLRPLQNNDPCPCGSGMKYKKCHGLEDRLRLQNMVITERAKREQFKNH